MQTVCNNASLLLHVFAILFSAICTHGNKALESSAGMYIYLCQNLHFQWKAPKQGSLNHMFGC